MTYFTYKVITDSGNMEFKAPLFGEAGSELNLHDVFYGDQVGLVDTIRIMNIDTEQKIVMAYSVIDEE